MKTLRYLLTAIAFCLLPVSAQAATCYWVGGTGNWDNSNAASWANGTGGTASSCGATGGIPKNAADTAIFDGSSGGGVVTVCGAATANCPTSSGLISITGINANAFTGTLDFATISPNVTLSGSFLNTGAATRTVSLGSGIYTLGNAGQWSWSTIGACICTGSSANIVLNGGTAQTQFYSGALTYGSISFGADTSGGIYSLTNAANITFTSCTINAPSVIQFRQTQTTTCTNGITFSGSSASAPVYIETDSASNVATTLAVGSATACSYCSFRGITGATSAITATNAFNLGGNGGTLSIAGPAGGGGGGFIIGGD